MATSTTDSRFHAFIAIDLGTTYSGFAFAVGKDSTQFFLQTQLQGADAGRKIPTAILLDKNTELVAFGKSAMEQYFNLEDDEMDDFYFFDRFKMSLMDDSAVRTGTKITAANGKSLDALMVFARSLEYFHKTVKRQFELGTGAPWVENEIKWIITVPAIWGDRAKKFMIDAAKQAGLTGTQKGCVEIALEPEAAALACRKDLLNAWVVLGKPKVLRYVVVDCGGGTIDVTVDDLLTDSDTIREVHHATGGPWGGTEVDKRFIDLFRRALGEHVADKISKEAWLRFSREQIEEGKRIYAKSGSIHMGLPVEMFQEIVQAGCNLQKLLVYGVFYRKWASQFIISPTVVEEIYEEPVYRIVQHVRALIGAVRGEVHCVLLVGGFSDCPFLIKKMETEFQSDSCRVIHPDNASLSVLKGAVMFGQNPSIVRERVSKYSYGVDAWVEFEEGRHPEANRFTQGGKDYCRHVFAPYVRAGDKMELGRGLIREVQPTKPDQKGMLLQIYRSPNRDVTYTNEPGCELLSKLHLSMPRVELGMNRTVQVKIDISGTKLDITAVDLSSGQEADVDYIAADP